MSFYFFTRKISPILIENLNKMKRREIIKYAAYATGAALSAPLALSILSGCKTDASTASEIGKLHFFNSDEFSIIKTIVDLILPKTDSPSATEVGVHTMIDSMVGTAYRPEAKEDYKKNFAKLFSFLSEKKFLSESSESQFALLKQLEEPNDEKTKSAYDGYLALKQQTIAYYLTTEEIGTKFLTYLPVPGKYQGCISLEEAGGKKFAE